MNSSQLGFMISKLLSRSIKQLVYVRVTTCQCPASSAIALQNCHHNKNFSATLDIVVKLKLCNRVWLYAR